MITENNIYTFLSFVVIITKFVYFLYLREIGK